MRVSLVRTGMRCILEGYHWDKPVAKTPYTPKANGSVVLLLRDDFLHIPGHQSSSFCPHVFVAQYSY